MPSTNTRPPISGLKRPSLAAGTSFEALYTASYVAPDTCIKRSASDTFIVHRAREQQQRARQEEMALLAQNQHDQVEMLSLWQLLCLTICMAGVQFTWTVELAYGTPYLLSLKLSKDMTALVWLAGPLSALIGAFSDRCTSRLGRRRPFMIGGGIFVCLSMLCVAYAKEIGAYIIRLSDTRDIPENIEEQERRAAIVVAVLAFYTLDFSLNAVQASCRALILDIPPLWQHQQANAWAARLSNAAMVVGYFTGFVDLVKVLSFLGDTQIKVFCIVAIAVFIVTISITCINTHEKNISSEDGNDEDESNHWYDTFIYVWKALRSLPTPIQRLCNVQFFAWLGWFPFLFYSTTWVSDIYFRTHPKQDPGSWAKGTRAGSFALLLHAIVSVLSGMLFPWLMSIKSCGNLFSTKNIYTAGNLIFAVSMLSTIFITNVWAATAIVTIVGISWSIVLWIPFALVGEYISTIGATSDHSSPVIRSPAFSQNREIGSNATLASLLIEESSNDEATSSRASHTNYGAIHNNENNDPVSSTHDTHDEADALVEEEGLDAGMVLGVHNMYIVFPQFAVAIIASLIFRVVSWVQHGRADKPIDNDNEGGVNVAWVLAFGGVMSFVATILSRRIIQVPNDAPRSPLRLFMDDRVSI
ncbi:hypothetical protein O0I10_003923 [Lichtheimia ornata]|uniref:Sucrose transporter n=1 Tax=Lichtheimia ornata TaxID=688661 RepID=A0AAD7V8Y3_9FUNG|nr:uncharacterized protein O0I10_003923 [Lichtheimia ornata]KAJ8660465.1 hypothetical protein O0I10_003923 [Lichtheimia ornata]